MRVFGWLLAGMGLVLSTVTALSMLGLFPLTIEVLNFTVTEPRDRLVFLASCAAAGVVGLVLLFFTRPRAQ